MIVALLRVYFFYVLYIRDADSHFEKKMCIRSVFRGVLDFSVPSLRSRHRGKKVFQAARMFLLLCV